MRLSLRGSISRNAIKISFYKKNLHLYHISPSIHRNKINEGGLHIFFSVACHLCRTAREYFLREYVCKRHARGHGKGILLTIEATFVVRLMMMMMMGNWISGYLKSSFSSACEVLSLLLE